MNNFFKSFIFSALWMIIIIILSLMPVSNMNMPNIIRIPHLDKLAHIFMYFVFTLLLIFGFRTYSRGEFKKIYYLISFILAIVLGGLTEIAQGIYFSSFSRQKDLMDFLANTTGVLIALFICYLQLDIFVWNRLFKLLGIKLKIN